MLIESFLGNLMPAPLLGQGPKGLLWWQWIGLPVLAVVGLAIGSAISRLLRLLLLRLVARTSNDWDDKVIKRLHGPFSIACTVVAMYLIEPFLELPPPAEALADKVFRTTLFVDFFWALFRMVDVTGHVLALSAWAKSHSASRSLLPIGIRISKVLLLGMGLVALLAELGFNVSSLIAGLGIGGLALALAGQKTVENLFGAFSIGLDQPFREGDFIKAEGTQGTVEAIGLRSTRIRTLERTLVSIPNGKLADMRLESVAARDKIRFAMTLGLIYGTSSAAVRKIITEIRSLLVERTEKVVPTSVVVNFKELGEYALLLDVIAVFQTTDFDAFSVIRQDMLLAILEIVEEAGSAVAFPSRMLHMMGRGATGGAAAALQLQGGDATMRPTEKVPPQKGPRE